METSQLTPNHWEVPLYATEEFFGRRTKYCLVIPVLNEADRIRRQLFRMKSQSENIDVILVDGGSTDGSIDPTYLRECGVRALLVKKGPGKLSAQLRVGLSYALLQGYEGVVLIDGNNKDNPDAIPKFVEALEKGEDHVQGSRFLPGGKEENTPFSRKWGIRLLHAPLISLAAGVRYTDTTNGFKAYSRRLLLDPRVQPFRDVFFSYELHSYMEIRAGQLGLRVSEIPVERVYPSKGPTPTKIGKYRGSLLMLGILFRACLNQYAPRVEQKRLPTAQDVSVSQ
jgi:dolichol-phosphate mannosyltransferase